MLVIASSLNVADQNSATKSRAGFGMSCGHKIFKT
jgi:hypothetical protein